MPSPGCRLAKVPHPLCFDFVKYFQLRVQQVESIDDWCRNYDDSSMPAFVNLQHVVPPLVIPRFLLAVLVRASLDSPSIKHEKQTSARLGVSYSWSLFEYRHLIWTELGRGERADEMFEKLMYIVPTSRSVQLCRMKQSRSMELGTDHKEHLINKTSRLDWGSAVGFFVWFIVLLTVPGFHRVLDINCKQI